MKDNKIAMTSLHVPEPVMSLAAAQRNKKVLRVLVKPRIGLLPEDGRFESMWMSTLKENG
jgi:hypothetical protein